MPLDEFVKNVECGLFIDYDGTGYYANADSMTRIPARPSEIREGRVRLEFTHVMWFNK